MPILSTKEESPTRTVLEIEIPAEEVGKAFAAVRRAYARKAALPGFRKGKAPEEVVAKRFADEIKGDVLEHLLPDAVASAIEERKLSILGRPHVDDLSWEPPGPIRFLARLDLKPAVDPGEYRGIPGRGPAGRADRRGDREGHRPHPRGARRVSPDRRPGRGAGRLRGRRHRGLVRRDPRSRPGPPHLPGREDHARGRPRRLDARDQRRAAGRQSRGDPLLPQDVRRRLSQRRVPREDRRLPGHAGGAQGEEASGRGRRVRPRRLRRRHGRERFARRCARACGTSGRPTVGASSAA